MTAIRSAIFNFVFYALWTPFVCISMLPSLLMPRIYAVKVAAMYQKGAVVLSKYILGLSFELRGAENKPTDGQTYLVASKHYSAYETLLLYSLFEDPTIIMKKELLDLPVFGWFLKKIEVIAIDRGKGVKAMQSLYDGARKVRDQGRPIVIFPQGTRVALDATPAQKPYKSGLIKLYSELSLPILPMAVNTGLYWPRNSFLKKSGKVIVEFLPLIPAGLPADQVMKAVESQVEEASRKLVEEGRRSLTKS